MSRRGIVTGALALASGCGRIDFDTQHHLVETIIVPSDGTLQQSATALADGELYELRASGTCLVGNNGPADAEYRAFSGGVPEDLGTDALTDVGLAIDDPVVNRRKTPSWGPYRQSHVYSVELVGRGAPIQVNFHDDLYANNSGSLTLEIFEP